MSAHLNHRASFLRQKLTHISFSENECPCNQPHIPDMFLLKVRGTPAQVHSLSLQVMFYNNKIACRGVQNMHEFYGGSRPLKHFLEAKPQQSFPGKNHNLEHMLRSKSHKFRNPEN